MAKFDFITHKANMLVKRYGTRDPFALCSKLHIAVRRKELCPQLKAFFFYQSRIKTIVLNAQTDAHLQRVLCAHELGHAVLHYERLKDMLFFQEQELFNQTDLTEFEANIFTAELLVPDERLLKLLSDAEVSFFEAAALLYVPAELLDFKFRILRSKGYELEVPYLAQSCFLKEM